MSAFVRQEAAPGETEFVALAAGEDRVRGRNTHFPCGSFLLCSGNTTLLKLTDSHAAMHFVALSQNILLVKTIVSFGFMVCSYPPIGHYLYHACDTLLVAVGAV